jgi:hypothetical protein
MLVKRQDLAYTAAMRQLSILLIFFFLSSPVFSQEREVLVRVFPSSFQAYQKGIALEPVALREEGKVYALEEGPQLLTLKSPRL